MKFVLSLIISIALAFGLDVFGVCGGSVSYSPVLTAASLDEEEEEQIEAEEEEQIEAEEEEQIEAEEEEEYYYEDEEEEEIFTDDELIEGYLDPMRFHKEKYDTTYNEPFERVWQAVLEAVEQTGCNTIKDIYRQDEKGIYKGVIQTDFCIFARGDTTFSILEKYSAQGEEFEELPIIHGGVWDVGRMQYRFLVKENEDRTVYLLMKGEISGREEHITEEVHFWDSNGWLEHNMMTRVRENVEKAKQ